MRMVVFKIKLAMKERVGKLTRGESALRRYDRLID